MVRMGRPSRVVSGGVAVLTILACWLVAGLLSPSSAAGARVNDLSVAWIARRPRIDYVWNSSNPKIEGWPALGEEVTWVANVHNLSRQTLREIEYRWLLDGEVLAAGETTIQRRGVTEVELPWSWDGKRHELIFEIDPFDAFEEVEDRNNRLLVRTDALAVGFWVERRLWRRMQAVVQAAGIGATTFEDWMQRRIRQFNEMAELAKYPGANKGVLDRWRIDAIHVVGNGKLPLSPLGPEVRDWGADPSSYPVLYPDTEDRSIDMQWGFPAKSVWYEDYDAWQLLFDSLVHELGHARYLIDVYAWNLTADNDEVDINPPPPFDRFGRYYTTPEIGLMNTSWGFIDRYSAIALNRIAGYRATQGHYNEPANIGVFLNDLPERNRVRLVTPADTTFPNRPVRIYRASSDRDPDWRSHPYQLRFDAVPDLETTTDGRGVIELGRNPFSDGPLSIEVDRNNTLAIVELIDGGTRRWGYLEARILNLAYWSGQTHVAEHELVIDGPICGYAGLGPNIVTPAPETLVDSREVTFEWTPIGRNAKLWISVDLEKPRGTDLGAGINSASVSFPTGRRVAWWLAYESESSPAGCPEIRTSTYFFDLP